MNKEIVRILCQKGADIVRFIDISSLPEQQRKGFTSAVVFCMALSKKFILAMRDGIQTERDEFVEREEATDRLADWLAEYLQAKGYRAYSQSEKSLAAHGDYDEKTRTSRLPHKTIAGMAGLGFIGKNNLLITKEYGCALSMCTVLTEAPVLVENYPRASAQCGQCIICKTICPGHAIHGNEWCEGIGRDVLIDVFKCRCPLKCMVNCPHTLAYALQTDSSIIS